MTTLVSRRWVLGAGVTAVAGNSTLSRIIQMVEEAQGSRAPTQRFVDQFARWYTPAVFVLAIAVAVLPPLLLGAAWMDWLYRALILLVVACPCAFALAVPVALTRALAVLARRGVLVVQPDALQRLTEVDRIVFDKTGTVLAHPAMPALVGKNQVAEPDVDGKLFRKEILEVAEKQGSGWVNYKFKNPANGEVQAKTSYVKKQGALILLAGAYLK